jgi:hypothetical protein
VGLAVERWSPAVLSTLGAILYLILSRHHGLPKTVPSLFSATITISAIAVGFFATARTAIAQLEDTRPLIAKLRLVERYEFFIGYMSSAIYMSFVLAVLSAGGLLIDFASFNWVKRAFFAVWLLSGLFALLAYVRVIRVLNVILDSPPGKSP